MWYKLHHTHKLFHLKLQTEKQHQQQWQELKIKVESEGEFSLKFFGDGT